MYLGTDATTGKQRWATTTVRGSKRYATQQLTEFVREAEYSKVRAGTITDLLDRWVLVAAPKWAPSTRRENTSIIEHHLKPHLGHLPVGKLTTADVDDLYGYLLQGGGPGGAPLSPGRVVRIHGVLHRAFAQAVKWEWVWFNPVSNASPPRVPPPEVRPPTVDAVVARLDAVRDDDPALFTYLQLAAATGARRSQLLGLRWGEIDFAHRSVGFARAFVEGHDGPVLRATKTHRSYSVAIDVGTMTVLVQHWQRCLEFAEQQGATLTVDSFVFSADPTGARPWLPNRVTKRFIQLRRRTGLGHFMATEMLGSGYRYRPCRNGSATPGRPRHSMCMPTASRALIATPPMRTAPSSLRSGRRSMLAGGTMLVPAIRPLFPVGFASHRGRGKPPDPDGMLSKRAVRVGLCQPERCDVEDRGALEDRGLRGLGSGGARPRRAGHDRVRSRRARRAPDDCCRRWGRRPVR